MGVRERVAVSHLVVELEVGHDVCEAVIDVAEVLENRVAALVAVNEDCIALGHVCAVRAWG